VNRRRWSALGICLLVVCSTVVASGIFDHRPTSSADRVAALEAQVKCPSCEDLSVAQSTAPSSLAVRHEIEHLVASGRSDAQILDQLTAAYGPTILLSPPTHGLALLVWLFPFVVLVAAASVVATTVRRARRRR
jgi:cytochrome c-type biogenesis protein CcmH